MNERALFVVLGVALIALTATTKPRGIRNNNPGNIRRTAIPWRGKVPSDQNTDPDFEQFIAPEWGIRAMARQLMTYANRGTVTVRGIVSTWAPPTENDTGAYVERVAGALGVAPDAPLNVERELPRLVDAIIRHENGSNPYPPALLERGISLA